MKFVISKAELLELMGALQNAVAQKATIPILSNVLVEAVNDELILTATDLVVGVRCFTEAKILEEGATTLPARRLFQLIRELPAVNIEVTSGSDDHATIEAGGSRFRVHGMHRSEFPALPELSGAAHFKISQKRLKELLYRTSFAVSREDNRYVLTGILMRIEEGKATFVGTDGKRLAKITTHIEGEADLSGRYVIPLKAVEEVLRSAKEEEREATVYLMEDKVAFDLGKVTIISKLLSGDYPNVDRVIPQSASIAVPLHREELMSLLRQVALFTTESANSVRFTLADGELTLWANAADVGEGKVSMPANYNQSKFEIAFNPHFFLDILRHSKDETVTLELTDSFNPGVITDSADGLFVLMPMRLSE